MRDKHSIRAYRSHINFRNPSINRRFFIVDTHMSDTIRNRWKIWGDQNSTTNLRWSGPSVIAVSATDLGLGSVAACVSNTCAAAVACKAVWRYGVVDSIRDFESLDPGSNPGTSACFASKGHGVTDSIGDCESPDPGSTPGAPANSQPWRWNTQTRKWKSEEKKQPKQKQWTRMGRWRPSWNSSDWP